MLNECCWQTPCTCPTPEPKWYLGAPKFFTFQVEGLAMLTQRRRIVMAFDHPTGQNTLIPLVPYDVPNTAHWLRCVSDLSYCPIFPGDTPIKEV